MITMRCMIIFIVPWLHFMCRSRSTGVHHASITIFIRSMAQNTQRIHQIQRVAEYCSLLSSVSSEYWVHSRGIYCRFHWKVVFTFFRRFWKKTWNNENELNMCGMILKWALIHLIHWLVEGTHFGSESIQAQPTKVNNRFQLTTFRVGCYSLRTIRLSSRSFVLGKTPSCQVQIN